MAEGRGKRSNDDESTERLNDILKEYRDKRVKWADRASTCNTARRETLKVSKEACAGLEGELYDSIDVFQATPKEIAANVELIPPMVWPAGCGPLACGEWIRTGNARLILLLMDEFKPNTYNEILGHRSFLRAQQRALREIMAFKALTIGMQKQATEAKEKGMSFPEGAKCRRVRCPEHAILNSFRRIMETYWHRYMLPFGCFFLDRGERRPMEGSPWKDWVDGMTKVGNSDNLIVNPYSVTCADILWLCHTEGYVERLGELIGMIAWAKRCGVNLLMHRCRTDNPFGMGMRVDFEQYVSLEKHMYMIGCIATHIAILQEMNHYYGGTYGNAINILSNAQREVQRAFHFDPESFQVVMERFIVREMNGNMRLLQDAFPKANKISERSR